MDPFLSDGSWIWMELVFDVTLFFAFEWLSKQAVASNSDSGLSHFQPMVSFLCGHGKYQNQYLDENKRWVSDPDPKATCTKDKLEILEYCRKVSAVTSCIYLPV